MQQPFAWKDGQLHVDSIPLAEIAGAAGTPTYVYSATGIRAAFERLRAAFAELSPELHYAVKACPNVSICRLLHELGAGMDVVSGGEMERAWLAGTPMKDVVFAGVGKTEAEIRAALDGRHHLLGPAVAGTIDPAERGPVGLFNVESESELATIARLAEELGVTARVCLRVNPNVDAETHEYTTTGKNENKFGIEKTEIASLFDQFAGHPAIDLVGLHVHIGSPVPRVEPYVDAVGVLLGLIDDLARRGHPVTLLNLGGGWPTAYRDGEVPPVESYARAVVPLLRDRARAGLQILLEPGRSIVANNGLVVTRVVRVKRGRARTFVICDAGMHTLIRPALYRAFHFIWPVAWRGAAPTRVERPDVQGLEPCDVVGPICETGDFLARDRPLPALEEGDLVAVFSAGAYGMSMVSNYNDHGRPAEVLVEGECARLVNARQSLASHFAGEMAPRELALGERARV